MAAVNAESEVVSEYLGSGFGGTISGTCSLLEQLLL